jgi:hypothetical protein
MSFLDNLENNLKALESRDEGGLDEGRRRDRDRERALAAAPWAEQLKRGPFAQGLMQQATLAGRQRRMKVNLMWLGDVLRLEARGQRLELRPAPGGVAAVFLRDSEVLGEKPVDLAGDPRELTGEWMAALDEQRRIEEQAALESDDGQLEE